MKIERLRAAFVGCGGIAEHYLSVYRDFDGACVVTCIDPDLQRATHAATLATHAAQSKSQPRSTADFNDALAADVDIVVINTPNHLHHEQAIAVLAAGKHLLLQKPVAASLADAEAISKAAAQAEQRRVISGLYLSYFDQPLMHDLRAMQTAGWFGEITHLYARLMHRGGLAVARQLQRGESNWRASLAQTGGGCFIQLAVHYVHLFRWLLDSPIVRVAAMTKNLHCPGIEGEDLACAILEFGNGALATLDMAWNTAGEQLSVHGTRGTIEYMSNQTLILDSDAGTFNGHVIKYSSSSASQSPGAPGAAMTQQTLTITAPLLGDVTNPFNQHRLFLEAVRAGRPAPVSIASGVEDLRVVQAVYEAARTGQTITL
jgi:UDP-N-acetyl-2-amino-2-deoxyglucuronate dehydrogenase